MREALLVIDVQRELVAELAPGRADQLLGTIAGLLARARDKGMPVLFVRHNDAWLVKDSPPWEIADAIAPIAGEPIVEKRFRDSFRETNLAELLSERGIDHLIVCGMQTEYCVDATIREAERRGIGVTLVADAHATYATDDLTEEQIRAHLHRLTEGYVGKVLPASEALAG